MSETYLGNIELTNETLKHYGILGMKWGVRRYQNSDGTLTEAGKKRYSKKFDKMSDKQLHKALQKQIRDARAAQNGGSWYNGLVSSVEIGEKSKAIRDRYNKDVEKWNNSKDVKDWKKKWDQLDRDLADGKIDYDEYEKKTDKLFDQRPQRDFLDLQWAYIYGKGYANDYIKKGGKDLSIARLEDLGYDKEIAEKLVKRLIKSGMTLGGK